LEKEERASVLVVDPTVIALGSEAGDLVQALVFSFPAATTTVMPASTAFAIAELRAELKSPPRDMLATHSPEQLSTTQLTPLMTPELDPDPAQVRTLTATRSTFLATPYVLPPTVPAPAGWVRKENKITFGLENVEIIKDPNIWDCTAETHYITYREFHVHCNPYRRCRQMC